MSFLLDSPADYRRSQLRFLCRTDLYFLLRFMMGRPDMEHPWLYARVKEVERSPNGYIDLWARDHRKSSIITFGKTVQDVLASHGEEPLPEWKGLQPTFGIFSHTRPIAKAFLRQIKAEFEQNTVLLELFPDILYVNPSRKSPRWSEDNGIVVRRTSNPKEATIEAWGLIDGTPIGKHFNVLIWDDVVVPASVTNPEMIEKTTAAWGNSVNLGDAEPRKRIIGTRWHFADTYRTIMDRGAAKPRIYTATKDNTLTGDPVLLTPKQLADKVIDMGPYIASANLLLNPIADSRQTFQRAWFEKRFDQHAIAWKGMNRAIICDPASKKKKKSDWTTIAVIGKSEAKKVYLLDFIRDRLNLGERAKEFLRLHRKWQPQRAAYEEYGLQADIEYIESLMEGSAYHFEISKLGGTLGKADRINRLIPVCAAGDLWLPEALYRTTHEKKVEEQIIILIEQEFLAWPVPVHDDGMDVISRYFDVPDFEFPDPVEPEHIDDRYNKPRRSQGSWMSR